jgi:hypothetical protein
MFQRKSRRGNQGMPGREIRRAILHEQIPARRLLWICNESWASWAMVMQAIRHVIAGAANAALYLQRSASAMPSSHCQVKSIGPPNTPAHGSRGRCGVRPKLRGRTSRRTDAPDPRPDTAQSTAATWQASARTQNTQYCTGRRGRSIANARKPACQPGVGQCIDAQTDCAEPWRNSPDTRRRAKG